MKTNKGLKNEQRKVKTVAAFRENTPQRNAHFSALALSLHFYFFLMIPSFCSTFTLHPITHTAPLPISSVSPISLYVLLGHIDPGQNALCH